MLTTLTTKTRRILPATAIAIVMAVAAPLAAAGQDDAVKKGQEVYAAQKCSVCHSIAGKGGKQSPLDGVGKKLTADEIRQWIVNPTEMTKKMKSTKKPPMPAKYGKLPPADVDALVAYMQSLK
jgi:mono/diheme cytochrome c family protein